MWHLLISLCFFCRLSYLHNILEEFSSHQRVEQMGQTVPLLLMYVQSHSISSFPFFHCLIPISYCLIPILPLPCSHSTAEFSFYNVCHPMIVPHAYYLILIFLCFGPVLVPIIILYQSHSLYISLYCRVYFKVVLHEGRKELISDLVTVLMERVLCLYKNQSFQDEVRK